MKRLCHAPNIAVAQIWADALRNEGISTSVQRRFVSSIAGDIPPDQALPELWLLDEQEYPQAKALIHQLEHAPMRTWQCKACGERVEGAFESCWNCGAWSQA